MMTMMMKRAPLILLSILLFALPIAFSRDAEQVLDVNRNPVLAGVEYELMPAIWGPTGGGLRLFQSENSNCPVTVVQDPREVFRGIPVKFNIQETNSLEINTNSSLGIEFTEKPECAESSKWMVFHDFDINRASVGIGGPQDHPGQMIFRGTFGIQKSSFVGYKLVFCMSGSPTCLSIGRYDDRSGRGGRRLILLNDEEDYNVTFDVVFVKVPGDDSVIKSVV